MSSQQLALNQCPFCLCKFADAGCKISHQQQANHWGVPPPDSDEVMAISSAEDNVPSPVPSNLEGSSPDICMDESGTHSGPSQVQASVPLRPDQDHQDPLSPLVSGNPAGTFDVSMQDAAPYGIATTEEELHQTIRTMLEDMVRRDRNINPVSPQSSSSTEANNGTSSSQTRAHSIWCLPENVDEVLANFIAEVFGRENQEPVDTEESENKEEDEIAGEMFGDTHSESDPGSKSSQFFTAANNSVDDLAGIPPVDLEPLPDIPFNTLNTPWGTPLSHCQPMLEQIHQERVCAGHAPDWPFADYLEFEFVKWMVVNDISQTARDKLIKLPIMEHCECSFSSNYALNKLLDKLPAAGPQWRCIERTIIGTLKDAKGENFLKEQIEIWVCDIIEVIQELIGNTTYGSKLVFVPWQVELNGDPLQQKIDEMWTADWWMRIQNQLPPGATVIPIILSSDATQLTNFSGGKSAWPVYISIGNIPKSIHAKISSYSTLLLAYLPVPKFDCFPAKERGDQKARLFHESMAEILRPLETAGTNGVEMDCGDGYTMIAGCRRNLCHCCTVKQDQHGNLPEMPPPPRVPAHTAVTLKAHDHGHTSSLFDNQGLKPFGKPFWADLPYANIFSSLTPEILHQLHKGVFKDHLMEWCLKLIKHTGGSVDNVDHCFKAMPRHSDLQHFSSGVTKLKQTTAKEHREMQKVFTAVMAGLVPDDVLPVIVAAIGFIHFARLPSHTTATLALLDDALECFHAHKDVFIKYKICTNFNINKIHAMSHYVEAILELGVADAYNMETPE